MEILISIYRPEKYLLFCSEWMPPFSWLLSRSDSLAHFQTRAHTHTHHSYCKKDPLNGCIWFEMELYWESRRIRLMKTRLITNCFSRSNTIRIIVFHSYLLIASQMKKNKIFYFGSDVKLEVDGNERTATMRLRTKNEKWKQKKQPSVLCQRATSSGSSDIRFQWWECNG